LNQNPQISCDLCGSGAHHFVLATPRLDGDLFRCENCGLYFVILPEPEKIQEQPINLEMERLASRALELNLVEPHVEESEQKWRKITAHERFDELQKITSLQSGSLLEIGSSTGEFLLVAKSGFQTSGIEADFHSCAVAQSRQLNCFNGSLFEANFPEENFNCIALYHVIEHVPSPSKLLAEIHRILQPNGWLIIETPNIANIWYKILGSRWRQFIPDHLFFFTPKTLTKSLTENGFEIIKLNSAGKAMSVRLFLSRLGRYHQPTSRILAKISDFFGLSDFTIRLKLGDVMRVYARRK
jgi:2-polyprenyl-3-methyl-5-hydroxy-6-metoxy-1,4-benzoquinol methylase